MLLLVLFGYSLISPVLFANARADVPACCKRGGKHQCAMHASGSPGNDATDVRVISSSCPRFPLGLGLSCSPHAVAVSKPASVETPIYQALSISDSKTRRAETPESGANAKRGPPTLLN